MDVLLSPRTTVIFPPNLNLEVMAKEKLKLTDFKVESFITSLDASQMEQTKGGLQVTIQGKKTNYEIRWTSIDTRVEATALQTVGSKGYDGFLIARVR